MKACLKIYVRKVKGGYRGYIYWDGKLVSQTDTCSLKFGAKIQAYYEVETIIGEKVKELLHDPAELHDELTT